MMKFNRRIYELTDWLLSSPCEYIKETALRVYYGCKSMMGSNMRDYLQKRSRRKCKDITDKLD